MLARSCILLLTYETDASLSALPRHKAKAQLNEAKKLLVAENDASLGEIEIGELICEVVLRMCFRRLHSQLVLPPV